MLISAVIVVIITSTCRGGRFLDRRRLEIPGSSTVDGRGPEYYSLANLYIGAKMQVYGRMFTITGADEAVLKYIDESEVHLPAICRDSLVEYLANKQEEKTDGTNTEHIKSIKVPVA